MFRYIRKDLKIIMGLLMLHGWYYICLMQVLFLHWNITSHRWSVLLQPLPWLAVWGFIHSNPQSRFCFIFSRGQWSCLGCFSDVSSLLSMPHESCPNYTIILCEDLISWLCHSLFSFIEHLLLVRYCAGPQTRRFAILSPSDHGPLLSPSLASSPTLRKLLNNFWPSCNL